MFLDTSVLIELLTNGKKSKSYLSIESNLEDPPFYISIVQIAELTDWCNRTNMDVYKALDKLEDIVTIVDLTEEMSIEGSLMKDMMRQEEGMKKFSLIDGIILACAGIMGQKLLTTDKDFRKAPNVIVI